MIVLVDVGWWMVVSSDSCAVETGNGVVLMEGLEVGNRAVEANHSVWSSVERLQSGWEGSMTWTQH